MQTVVLPLYFNLGSLCGLLLQLLFKYISYLVLQQRDDLCQFTFDFSRFYMIGLERGKQKQTGFDILFMIGL